MASLATLDRPLSASFTPLGINLRIRGHKLHNLPGNAITPFYVSSEDGERQEEFHSLFDNSYRTNDFVVDVLEEGVNLVDSIALKNRRQGQWGKGGGWKRTGTKEFKTSEAPVEVSTLVLRGKEMAATIAIKQGQKATEWGKKTGDVKLDDESWYARRSVHEDKATKGTASWEEFTRHFLVEHAQAEMGWAPDVVGVRCMVTWPVEDLEGDEVGIRIVDDWGRAGEEGVQRWGGVKMGMWEMKHEMPSTVLMSSRVFSIILVMAERLDGKGEEFIVVSIPVDHDAMSMYWQEVKAEKCMFGKYSSVERIRKMRDGRIEWIMATASDAGGAIPKWATNMGLKNLIADDVKYYMEWVDKLRDEDRESRSRDMGDGSWSEESESKADSLKTRLERLKRKQGRRGSSTRSESRSRARRKPDGLISPLLSGDDGWDNLSDAGVVMDPFRDPSPGCTKRRSQL